MIRVINRPTPELKAEPVAPPSRATRFGHWLCFGGLFEKLIVAAFILAILIVPFVKAQAGTVYKDRPVPVPVTSGGPCLVQFGTLMINANLIQQVGIGKFSRMVNNPKFGLKAASGESKWIEEEYEALAVTLVNGARYHAADGDPKAKETAFLELVKKECRK